MFYNRFRYYDCGTGQDVSPDPIGLLGGVNPYGYVHNPLSWVDPLGLSMLALPAPSSLDPWGSGASLGSALTPKGGITVEMAMSPGQANPGGWATVDHIPDVNYIRNQLAAIPEFKPEISHVQQFHIPEGIRIQTGPVGPQISGGGGYAILVVEVKYKFLTMLTGQGYHQLVSQEKFILISVGAEMIDNFMVADNLAGYDKKK